MRLNQTTTNMLKIHLIGTRGNILRTDLSGIVSDYQTVKQYHRDLVSLCREKDGAGISANQVGLRENFFFAAPAAKFPVKRGKPVAHMCVNPSWEPAESHSQIDSIEGCLSLPGRQFTVPRIDVIKASWTNAVGHPQAMRLKGWAARVFQHECDHLRGITLLESGAEIKDEPKPKR